jgi:hypothetical protein
MFYVKKRNTQIVFLRVKKKYDPGLNSIAPPYTLTSSWSVIDTCGCQMKYIKKFIKNESETRFPKNTDEWYFDTFKSKNCQMIKGPDKCL